MARPTFWDRSQRHWRTKRSGSGARSVPNGVTTGESTPVIRGMSVTLSPPVGGLERGAAAACCTNISDSGGAKPFAKGPDSRVPSGPPPMRLQGFPGAALVAGAGLILALTALLAASHNPEDLPSFRLRVEVPDPLLLASGAAFALAVAIVIGIAFSRDRRRRETELQREEEPSRLPWWAIALLAGAAVPAASRDHHRLLVRMAIRRELAARVEPPDDAGRIRRRERRGPTIPILSLPWLGWLVGLLALLAGLATLAMARCCCSSPSASRAGGSAASAPSRTSRWAKRSRKVSTISRASRMRASRSSSATAASSASRRARACRGRPGRLRRSSCARRCGVWSFRIARWIG